MKMKFPSMMISRKGAESRKGARKKVTLPKRREEQRMFNVGVQDKTVSLSLSKAELVEA